MLIFIDNTNFLLHLMLNANKVPMQGISFRKPNLVLNKIKTIFNMMYPMQGRDSIPYHVYYCINSGGLQI